MEWIRRGREDETEMTPLLNSEDETLTDEAGGSRGSTEQLRLMVLGGDDALMDKACGTILGERKNRDTFKFGELKPREARVCGRQVSVLKTPCRWLEHLKSYIIFRNGVNSLKYDIQFFESQLFPGPHAFLLVHRDMKNSGRENYLLHALSDVFGKKVLDYCMVLFIDEAKHNGPKNYCLKMCGDRYHILQNTDKSIYQLFRKIETMVQWKNCDFFTNHLDCFRKAENYFEEKNYKLKKQCRETVENLKEEINDMKERNEMQVNELNERIKDEAKSKDRGNQQQSELEALKNREKQTNEDFQKLKDTERQLIDDKEKLQRKKEKLQREVEKLKDNVKQLQSNLTEAKVKEDFLVSKLQSECTMIQREEAVQVKQKELHERERELERRVEELDDTQRNLDVRQKQLEIREREVTQRVSESSEQPQSTAVIPSVSGDKNRPLDECEELKSREHSEAGESHGIYKHVRRNSKELQPPDMSESGPLHTL